MSALGYYVPASRERHRHPISAAPGRLYLGVSALWPSFGRHLRQGRAGAEACGRAWKLIWTSAAFRAKARHFTAICCRRLNRRGWRNNRVSGNGWMAVGDAGRHGGPHYRRRDLLRDALRRSGQPRGSERRSRHPGKGRGVSRHGGARIHPRSGIRRDDRQARIPGTFLLSQRARSGWFNSCGAASVFAI